KLCPGGNFVAAAIGDFGEGLDRGLVLLEVLHGEGSTIAGFHRPGAVGELGQDAFEDLTGGFPLASSSVGLAESNQASIADVGNILQILTVAEGAEPFDGLRPVLLKDQAFTKSYAGKRRQGAALALDNDVKMSFGRFGFVFGQQPGAEIQVDLLR